MWEYLVRTRHLRHICAAWSAWLRRNATPGHGLNGWHLSCLTGNMGKILLFIALLASLESKARSDAAELRRQAEAFAGGPVSVDPRLDVPACASYRFEWIGAGKRALGAGCGDAAWRITLPVGGMREVAGGPREYRIRRGERVQIAVEGGGFAVRVEAVAEANGAVGETILMRNGRSGNRFAATIAEDGSLHVKDRRSRP